MREKTLIDSIERTIAVEKMDRTDAATHTGVPKNNYVEEAIITSRKPRMNESINQSGHTYTSREQSLSERERQTPTS